MTPFYFIDSNDVPGFSIPTRAFCDNPRPSESLALLDNAATTVTLNADSEILESRELNLDDSGCTKVLEMGFSIEAVDCRQGSEMDGLYFNFNWDLLGFPAAAWRYILVTQSRDGQVQIVTICPS